MSSQTNNDRPTWCRNRLTRASWALPLLLLIASPVTRALAVGGTLMLGTGCAQTTPDDCEQWRSECLDACDPNDGLCMVACEQEFDECLDIAAQDAETRASNAEAAAEVGMACVAALACTLDAIGDSSGDGDGDGDDSDYPVPASDDYGDDWGEQQPEDTQGLAAPEDWTDLTDLPDLPDEPA